MRQPDPQRLLLIAFGATLAFAVWLHLHTQPPDFANYTDLAKRKDAFIAHLCPLISQQNKAIRDDRALVRRAREQLADLAKHDQVIIDLGKKYALTTTVEPSVLIDRLLRRADVLPSALVLAQAAIESGWGTSELYTSTGNLFGRRCFYVSDCYSKGGTKYRVFAAPHEAVALYFQDLNTLMPYKRLRDLRAQQISDPTRLAEGLRAYSSRGVRYVSQVRQVIEENRLDEACGDVTT